MTINRKCRYYHPRILKDDIVRSTYSSPPEEVRHECHHPDGFTVTQDCLCNVTKPYCPHNPERARRI